MDKIKKIIKSSFSMPMADIPSDKQLRDKRLILFGASGSGKFVFNKLFNKNIKVDYFCDNDPSKWGKKICGREIISTKKLMEIDRDSNIIVSSQYFSEIAIQLLSMGFKNVFPFERLIPGIFQKLFVKSFITQNYKKILKLHSLLKDKKSKKVLENIINYRLTLNPFLIKEIVSGDQYFPKDIINLTSKEVFVDGGAYVGDTVLGFMKVTNNKFKKIFSFEPDKSNYKVLVQTIKINNLDDRVVPLIYGIYHKSIDAGFCQNAVINSQSSRIALRGTNKISAVSLDDYLKNHDVTFIKMDIEGAEIPALIGAKNIITKNKPKLAISAYHQPRDLWEIPLLIKSFVPEYRIYLRHHSGSIAETVCYAAA